MKYLRLVYLSIGLLSFFCGVNAFLFTIPNFYQDYLFFHFPDHLILCGDNPRYVNEWCELIGGFFLFVGGVLGVLISRVFWQKKFFNIYKMVFLILLLIGAILFVSGLFKIYRPLEPNCVAYQ